MDGNAASKLMYAHGDTNNVENGGHSGLPVEMSQKTFHPRSLSNSIDFEEMLRIITLYQEEDALRMQQEVQGAHAATALSTIITNDQANPTRINSTQDMREKGYRAPNEKDESLHICSDPIADGERPLPKKMMRESLTISARLGRTVYNWMVYFAYSLSYTPGVSLGEASDPAKYYQETLYE